MSDMRAGHRWRYVGAAPKPHVHPIVGPSGRLLTTDHAPDHPWQRGLWFVIKFVNGTNFWEELGDHGIQRHRDERVVEWRAPDGTTVLEEHRHVVEAPVSSSIDEVVGRSDAGAWALDWSSELRPRVDVVLDRTPHQGFGGYGGLALRGAADWRDTRLRLPGEPPADAVTGVPARWCDLSGPDAGIALLDHPDNPRHPVPWYANVRNPLYGLPEGEWTNFVNAACCFHEPLRVAAGARLGFRYRLLVHDGSWTPERIEEAWASFAR